LHQQFLLAVLWLLLNNFFSNWLLFLIGLHKIIGQKHCAVHLILVQLRRKLFVFLDFGQEEHVRLRQLFFQHIVFLLDLNVLDPHGLELKGFLQTAFLC
jgi:hypothetical protein